MQKFRSMNKGFLGAGALVAMSMGAGSNVYAQSGTAADENLEEVVVTGTRLVRRDYEAASPISTVDAEQFANTGSPTIETVLNTLPQFVPSLTSTSNNPSAGGRASVSLRGLGTSRTLVLLDGRRIVGSNSAGTVDLNLIPANLIKNVEVITGGASAVYGSDAVAGVVNIKTRDITGLEFTINSGSTAESDGGRLNFGVLGGVESDDGRAYAWGSVNYADRESVLQGDREFSEVTWVWYETANEGQGGFQPFGSSTIRQGRYVALPNNLPTKDAIDEYFTGKLGSDYDPDDLSRGAHFGFNPDATLFSIAPVRNFTGDANEPQQPVNENVYSYNYAPPNYLELPLERKSFFGRVGVEMNDNINLFGQLLLAKYSSETELAPTPAWRLFVRPDNPHMDPGFAKLLASRADPDELFRYRKRMIEAGGRISTLGYNVSQTVIGGFGALPFGETWEWDFYASSGSVQYDASQQGNVSRSAWNELATAEDHGASVCNGEAINPFGIGSVQPCFVKHYTRSATNTTAISQRIAEGFIRGEVMDMPFGTGAIQAALGFMYKEDQFAFLPDAVLTATTTDPVTGSTIPDIVGFNAADTVRGETSTKEFYVEAGFPLVNDAPWAKRIELTLGGRYGEHSVAEEMVSYKAEGTWEVTNQFTARSSFQRAVRAPRIGELFAPATLNFPNAGLGDPCSNDFNDKAGNVLGAQDDPRARALCIAQGIPEASLDSFLYSNGQFEGLSGGNPNLQEETADTFTLGFVFRGPDEGALSGLQGSVDFYNIELEDVVGSLSASTVVSRCFNPAFNPSFSNNNVYCNFFERDAGTGSITNVLERSTNIASQKVRGIDFQIDYSFDIGIHRFSAKWVAINLIAWDTRAAAGEAFGENAGTAGSSFDVLPKWKQTLMLNYAVSAFDVSLRHRIIGRTYDEDIETFELKPVSYIDLYAGYRFEGNALDGLSIYGGITNLTDEQPPLYPSNQQSNTDPATYDVLGRRFFLSLRYTMM